MLYFKTDNNFFVCIKIILTLVVYTLIGIGFVYLSYFREIDGDTFTAITKTEVPTVIIDAGHGGFDGGAVSENGIAEKDINLSIALKLRELFLLSNVPCALTRSDDRELTPRGNFSSSKKRGDLIARTQICESFENPIFISVHQNKFPSGKYKGLQVFYSKNNKESVVLADIIRKNNRTLDSSNNREIKPAGREIFVLDKVESPAVLIECGFLSNKAETRLLVDSDYQTKLALMIYQSVFEYINRDKSI